LGQLAQALAEIEQNLVELGQDIKSLKSYVAELEEENLRLKKQISVVAETSLENLQKNAMKIRQEAWENMDKLYSEGSHICHVYFGEPLSDACLFCGAMLATRGHDE
jgi:regulator of replication initiation timing